MTLIEIFNKYAWVGVLKNLVAGGLFTTDSDSNYANNAVVADVGKIALRRARNDATVDASVSKFTWAEAMGITQLNPVLGLASGAIDNFECVACVVNVPDESLAIATAQLAEITSETQDDQSFLFYPGQDIDPIKSTKAITNVFYQRRSGTAVMRLQMGAK